MTESDRKNVPIYVCVTYQRPLREFLAREGLKLQDVAQLGHIRACQFVPEKTKVWVIEPVDREMARTLRHLIATKEVRLEHVTGIRAVHG